jgi:hypothetical protein
MRRAMNQDSLQIRMCNDADEWSRCGHLFVVADGATASATHIATILAELRSDTAYYDALGVSDRPAAPSPDIVTNAHAWLTLATTAPFITHTPDLLPYWFAHASSAAPSRPRPTPRPTPPLATNVPDDTALGAGRGKASPRAAPQNAVPENRAKKFLRVPEGHCSKKTCSWQASE